MVKSIIKRIIVGVGIALILMALKGQLLMQVNAESINVNPTKMCAIPNVDSTCNWSNVQWWQIYERSYYGTSFGSSSTKGRVVWNFEQTNISNKTYDITGLIHIVGVSNQSYPNKAYIQDGRNHIYSCHIDNTKSYNSNDFTGDATITCNNVYLSSNYFYFYLINIGQTTGGGLVAITPLTLNESVSAKQAEELEEINDNITDDSVDTGKADSDINDMKNKVASNGSITQLLTLPITLYQSILNSASGSCSGAFDLGSLLGHHLELPCIQPQRYLGNSIWTIIDMLCSGLFILSFRKKMVDIFNHMTSLNDRGNELE